MTSLFFACARGRIGIARALVAQPGVSVSARNQHGSTPLQMAAAHGQLEIVRWLVQDCNADVNSYVPLSMDSPLHAAAKHDHLDCVIWLVEKAAARIQPDTSAGDWPAGNNVIAHAAREGHLRVVRWLLTHCQFRSDSLEVALAKACGGGHFSVVRLLVEQGNVRISEVLLLPITMNITSNCQRPPPLVHLAACVLLMFVPPQVSVNAVSHSKSVALYACARDRPAILQYLVEKGLNLEALVPHSALHEVMCIICKQYLVRSVYSLRQTRC